MTASSTDVITEHAAQAAADGFASYWLSQSSTGGGFDALTSIVLAAEHAPNIEFGTAIIPTLLRHPLVMATQALTTQSVIGNRLALGIGLSHRETMVDMLGLEFPKPIRHMREYLTILQALLRDHEASFRGEYLTCNSELAAYDCTPPPVIVAALGEQMLRLTGRLADGTILWVVGPKTIRDFIVPHIQAGAEKGGRPAPRVIASLPTCVTDKPEEVREMVAAMLVQYGQLPFYRAVLDREGAATPGDVAVLGNEDQVREQIAALADAGATEFSALEFPAGPEEAARTRALLKELASES